MKSQSPAGYKIMLIANPAAGNKTLEKRWQKEILPFLKKKLIHFDFEFTKYRGEAPTLCRQALQSGYNLILSMGGDGTLNEVLNGFFHNGHPVNPDAVLGILPFGSGGDFIRSLKFERDYRKIIPRLLTRQTQKIDVGLVEFSDKQYPSRYFINTVQVGLGAAIMRRVNQKNKKIPPLLRYVSGSFQGFLDYKSVKVRLQLYPQGNHVVNLNNLIVANGQYFGRGMIPAPQAILDDGFFDVVVIKDMSFAKFVLVFPQLYTRKKFLPANVETFRATKLTLELMNEHDHLETELDGEPTGIGNLSIKVIPKALQLKV